MSAARNCLIFIAMHLVYVTSAQDVLKRVPQGFVGMRGKKLMESNELDRFYKRKPQFFVGVKGKKSLEGLEDELNEFVYKRAPTGFVGMRGKKDDSNVRYSEYEYPPKAGSLIGKIDYATNEEVNSAVDLTLLNDFFDEYLRKTGNSNPIDAFNAPFAVDEQPSETTNEVDKRAANIHQFFGVRGKKSIQNKRPFDLTFRGKFIGVRGKKDLQNNGALAPKFLWDQNGPFPKRKAQMGFLGMRGKKWWDDGKQLTLFTRPVISIGT